MRHHPGCLPHEFANRAGKASSAGTLRLLPMSGLIVTHGLDDGAAAQIRVRQSIEVTLQMPFDLPFGFGDKPQTGAIPQHGSQGTDAE